MSQSPFCEIHHHLSDTVCHMVMPEKTLVYERHFYRDRFVTPSRFDAVPEQIQRTQELLTHPNIIPFSKPTQNGDTMTLSRPYVNGENLYFYVSLANLPKAAAMAACRNLAKIVKFIHSKDLVCMALTPENIIIDGTGVMHLVDCCLESVFYDNYHDRNTATDMLFLGPEGLNESSLIPHKKSRDIWCLGLIMFLAFTGSYPWPTNNKMKVLSILLKAELVLPEGLHPGLAKLVSQMLDKDPDRRPDIKSVCHELKLLDREGQCCRIGSEWAKSAGELPVFKPKTTPKLNKTGPLTQSCKLEKGISGDAEQKVK